MIGKLWMRRIQKKTLSFALFLCISIMLTNLFTYFNFISGFTYLGSNSDEMSVKPKITASNECYPLYIRERIVSKTTFPGRLMKTGRQRLPMRFPIPPVVLLIGAAFFFLFLYRQKKGRFHTPYVVFNQYIIRYIHDQDGENYHSTLS